MFSAFSLGLVSLLHVVPTFLLVRSCHLGSSIWQVFRHSRLRVGHRGSHRRSSDLLVLNPDLLQRHQLVLHVYPRGLYPYVDSLQGLRYTHANHCLYSVRGGRAEVLRFPRAHANHSRRMNVFHVPRLPINQFITRLDGWEIAYRATNQIRGSR